jgi:hypothetical protein
MTVEIFGTDDADDAPAATGPTGDPAGTPPPQTEDPDDTDPATLAAEAVAFADASVAIRTAGYRRLARRSFAGGALALTVAVVGWVFGLQTADPLYRVLVVVGGLLLLVAVLTSLLAMVAALPRESEDALPRESEDALPRESEDASSPVPDRAEDG